MREKIIELAAEYIHPAMSDGEYFLSEDAPEKIVEAMDGAEYLGDRYPESGSRKLTPEGNAAYKRWLS